MVRRSRAKSSSLFLLELIFAILFFSIASAVCIQLFVKSHLLSQKSQALNYAVMECSGAAEAITASDSLSEACSLLKTVYPDASVTEGDSEAFIEICYDDAFAPCSQPLAVYRMTAALRTEDHMLYGTLTVLPPENDSEENNSEPLYQLDVEHTLQRRRTQ